MVNDEIQQRNRARLIATTIWDQPHLLQGLMLLSNED